MTHILLVAATYLIVINLITWVLYRYDLKQATSGHRRIPEMGLLTLALLGGTPAARRVQRLGHYKFLKPPTRRYILRLCHWHQRFTVLGFSAASIVLAQIYLTSGR
ncbi:hypothetical protein PEL8287_01343 [Roseovarius litorisediminis]|uniref:DUF1294 domain-containing protein n=1 Tax=Roseovarius litorisediminis TaxID=1312363 RepID=A0A1Y5S073_9RHOB|nr:DUF1294 domain-containing protein [Roseovarius litorisediminis]SLN29361.1 hypothetical protein PEL8287_01343 [Roseovarius litorisediminis]